MKNAGDHVNEIRIIAGKWRGRRIQFPSVEGLRPTADRLRETLFNWLQFDIVDKVCLDAYAGSGALGFEALSRGAGSVLFLDSSSKVTDQLTKQCQILQCQTAQIVCQDALLFLMETKQQFDVIFLDPPFQINVWLKCLDIIEKRQLLTAHGKIYIEMPACEEIIFPESWQITKETRVGQVIGRLLSLKI